MLSVIQNTSMLKIIEINDIDRKAWEELAAKSPVSSWFQTEEAYLFYDGLAFLEAFALGVENEGLLKGVIIGYIQKDGSWLKRFLSRRAIVTGGPLLSAEITKDELGTLLNALKSKIKKRAVYVETRNFNDYSPWQQIFEECGFVYEPHYDIWVNTANMDQVNDRLGKSRKRDIRVSLRDGATVLAHPTIEHVREYYSILEDLYKNKVKTPLLPLSFFEKLYQLQSSVFLFVNYEDKIIGGTVCVCLQEKCLYEMYACGRDGVYKNIFPSELATFAGMQYAVEHGMPRFDMMGAGNPNDGGYGVRDFKLKFGGELYEFGRNKYICNHLLYSIGKLGVRILKKL